jgi:hypothetical protein
MAEVNPEILQGPNGERLERTGEMRTPKSGEWYWSLSIGGPRMADADFSLFRGEILRPLPPPHERRSAREIALDLVEWQMATGKFLTAKNGQKAPVIPVEVLERAIVAADSSFALRLISPEPALLYCPKCGKQHCDEGEWATRPHKTHRCVDDRFGKGCGEEWKPRNFPTVGVAALIPPETPPPENPDKYASPHILAGVTEAGSITSEPARPTWAGMRYNPANGQFEHPGAAPEESSPQAHQPRGHLWIEMYRAETPDAEGIYRLRTFDGSFISRKVPSVYLSCECGDDLIQPIDPASSPLRETPRRQLWDEARTKKLVEAVWKADTPQNNFDDSTHADYCVRAVIEQMIELERAASPVPGAEEKS